MVSSRPDPPHLCFTLYTIRQIMVGIVALMLSVLALAD
jgi:hypothetical protein